MCNACVNLSVNLSAVAFGYSEPGPGLFPLNVHVPKYLHISAIGAESPLQLRYRPDRFRAICTDFPGLKYPSPTYISDFVIPMNVTGLRSKAAFAGQLRFTLNAQGDRPIPTSDNFRKC